MTTAVEMSLSPSESVGCSQDTTTLLPIPPPSEEDSKSPRTNRPRMVDASRIRMLLENNKKSEAFKLLDRWESQWREIVDKKKNRVRKEPTEFNRFVQSTLPELRAKNPEAKPNDLMVQCAGLWKEHKAQATTATAKAETA